MTGEDRKYLDWIRSQPCLMRSESPCNGPTEAHHAVGAGMGMRNHDHTTMPLCRQHHTDRHALSGPFRSMNKYGLRRWERDQYSRMRRRYLANEAFGTDLF